MAAQPDVSVVISTYRRSANLEAIVSAFERQTFSGSFELLIVDNGSPDDTSEVLARLSESSSVTLRPLRIEENRGPARARNLGWRSARAPLVLFTDDDCIPESDWVASMASALRTHDVAQGRTEPNRSQRGRRGPFSRTQGIREERGFYETCNMGYRGDLLERLGGFDESFFFGGEDTDLGWRARELGARMAFVEDGVILHDITPSSFRGYMRSVSMWKGLVRVVQRHPGLRRVYLPGPFWRWSHATAFVALLGIAGLVVAGLTRSLVWAAAGVVLGVPYVWYRMYVKHLPVSRKRRLLAMPLLFVADVAELALHVWTSILVRVRPEERSTSPSG